MELPFAGSGDPVSMAQGGSQSPSASIVAEHAFLSLAREWQAAVEEARTDRPLDDAVDIRSLACLLLTVEWGARFTDNPIERIERNREEAERRELAWAERLPWDLCLAWLAQASSDTDALAQLTSNLDHHDSSVRYWMMRLAWFVATRLDRDEAARRLLKNLADTLGHALEAAGLAARLFDTEQGFLDFARTFTPPARFENQYEDRLATVRDMGIRAVQAPFVATEVLCRKEIERVSLGSRI
jgi:hypothetical protein